MNPQLFSRRNQQGQGLIELVLLIAIVATITAGILTVTGSATEEAFVKVCAGLGNENCQATDQQVIATGTPPLTAVPTPTLVEADPTRKPFATATPTPTAVPTINQSPSLTVITVDDVSGAPVRGVWVQLLTASGKYVADRTTGADGSVLFALSQPGNYRVLAYSGQWWEAAQVGVSGPTQVVIRLKTLTIKAVDDVTNAPRSGLWVQIKTAGGNYVADRTTDARGQITFSVVNGEYDVLAYTGQWWQAARVEMSGSKEITLRLKTLSIKAVDDATNAPRSVWVQIKTASGNYVADRTTDANGQITFSVVNGEYDVLAYTGQWWQAARVGMSSSKEITLRLKTLTVQVVNETTNAPVSGAWIQLITASRNYVADRTTGANGQVVFSVVNGSYIVLTYSNGQWTDAARLDVNASTQVIVRVRPPR
ncbi:MAG: carboxypeptidase regulatory-like domain-containing protein [Chloroflexi bacterium]|nr:carboxypeptidase regulatory-like domain-containing protein [Chloroflexota bacterium]